MNLVIFLLLPVISSHVISSPIITDYGVFHEWEYCPTGQYACGICLKVAEYQKGGDDTGLNSIGLFCRPYGSDIKTDRQTFLENGNATENLTRINGGVGEFGDWEDYKFCPDGTSIIGFRLRSDFVVHGGDNVGAVNFAAYCGRLYDNRVTEDTPFVQGETSGFGDWTAPQFCKSGYLVCGISSQIEENQGNMDDTSLNNVKLKCCKVSTKETIGKLLKTPPVPKTTPNYGIQYVPRF